MPETGVISIAARVQDEPPLKVILADDDPLVRRLLRDVLESGGIKVIAQASSGRECIELALYYKPDLLVVDLSMPDGDGFDVIKRVRASAGDRIEIVVLSINEDEEAALLALRLGASGFLTKNMDLSHLPRALRAAVEGEAVISRRMSRRLIERLRHLPEGQLGMRPVRSPLTPREWEVLDLLCAGRSTDDIADELVLSIETVRSHIKNILRKTSVRTREEAIAMAPMLRAPAA